MAGKQSRVHRGLVIAFVGVLCAAMLTPLSASADTNLVIGGNAVIAYANGDQVRLRESIGYEAPVVANYDEGTVVAVLDGPAQDADGNFWYQVSVGAGTGNEKVGYIVSDFLALETGVAVEQVPQEQGGAAPEANEAPAVTQPAAVIAIAYVAGTNGDGVRCRAAADAASAVISVIPEGNTIEITGAPVDIWQPINCAGLGGFIASQFVAWEPPTVEAPAQLEEPVVEEPVVEDAPVVDEAPPVEEPVVEEPIDEAPPVEEPAVDDAPAPVGSSEVTGSATIVGTNGDGLRCRVGAGYDANVITVLREGIAVDLRGAAQGEWQPVYCASVAGFVHTDFLGDGGGEAGAAEASSLSTTDEGVGGPAEGLVTAAAIVTGSGIVSGTNGDGLRCRSGGNLSASTITVLPEGTELQLTGSASNGWQPVNCAGMDGYVHTDYLSTSGSGGAGTTAGSDGGGSSVTGNATVNSGIGGLNCRSGGNLSASVITVLPNSSSVQLRGAASGDWQPVFCANQSGFVFSSYLNYGGSSAPGNTDTGTDTGSGSGNSSFTSGQSAQVTGTGGGGLRLRASASLGGTVLGVIGEGQTVSVRSGSTGDWVAVTYNGTNGFVHSDYLGSAGNSSNPGNTNTNPGPSSGSSGLASGDRASTTDALNLRYSASYSSGVAAVAPAGTVVAITGGASNGFYPVDWDGLAGYMHGDYLVKTSAALSERGGSAAPSNGSPGGTQSGSVIGNSLVDYAMRYLGYPYVWATHGPSSFDCSGFTYWVVKNVLGRDIGAGLWTQVSAGQAVSRSALQPGDLVFFQNTYTTGLSHVGMYIGNSQFIHAENPSTGVRISDLNSTYYSSRWYGAVRLG